MTEDCKTASTMISANCEGATTCPGYNRQPQSETRGGDQICESCCYTRTSSKAFPHMSKKSARSWRKNSMHSTFSSLVAFILLALLLTCNISIADDATGTTTSAPPSRYGHYQHLWRIFFLQIILNLILLRGRFEFLTLFKHLRAIQVLQSAIFN